MVAGSSACLGISDPPEPSNFIIVDYMQLGCVIIYTNMALWCFINNHGLLACTPVLDWYDSVIWLPFTDCQAHIAHHIPKSDQSHNIYENASWWTIIITATCVVGGQVLHLLQRVLTALTDLLVKQSCDSERQKYKTSLKNSRYSIQLQISNNQPQALSFPCGGAGFEN